jgi:dihydrodipicolinate synthase/N-acetylneuraminate lyase
MLQVAMAGTSSVIGGRILRGREPGTSSPAGTGSTDLRIRGPFLILSTPFTASGAVDFDALARQARFVDWCGCPGMIWPQSGDSIDLLSTGEKRQGMEVLANAARGLRTALCLGVQGKDTAGMLDFARYAEKLAPAAIISRPPDSGKTEDDMRQYWCALASVAKRPVILQTTGGVAYKGPVPSLPLLIELAKRFPNFGYVKEEAGSVIARTRALLAARPPIRRVFSARGGLGWLYELRLGTEGLITERAIYADVLTRIWELHQSGSDPEAVRDAYSKFLLIKSSCLPTTVPHGQCQVLSPDKVRRRGRVR